MKIYNYYDNIYISMQVACSDPDKCYEICGSRSGCSNVSFVFLVLKLCPIGKFFKKKLNTVIHALIAAVFNYYFSF